MSQGKENSKVISGGLAIFSAEAITIPLGFILAIFLTRRLGPEGYGLYALCVALVSWVEWTAASFFSRAVIQWSAKSEDWKKIAGNMMLINLAVSVVAALATVFFSTSIASFFSEPSLAGYIRLLALNVPIFVLSTCLRSILIGRGFFIQRAWSGGLRGISRVIFIVVFVQAGFSVSGAIAGCIGASLIELLYLMIGLKLSWKWSRNFQWKSFLSFSVPLFLFSVILHLFSKSDLFLLQSFSEDVASTGVYALAQNITVISGAISMAVIPLIQSEVARLQKVSGKGDALDFASQSIRVTFLFIPLAALIACLSKDFTLLFFPPEFLSAAPIMSILIFAAWAVILNGVIGSILMALEQPFWTLSISLPLIPVMVFGYPRVIPLMGSMGAALVTLSGAMISAFCALFLLKKRFGIKLPFLSLMRSIGVSMIIYLLMELSPLSSCHAFIKMGGGVIAVLVFLWGLGERKDGHGFFHHYSDF